ncbi:hypothetical protein llap_11891 [Limosa lapponica baueri]|uniref:Uncharacterized protein n=1 Tax=Limosa lapponica baueri TaxID=1758121 RepID=A0A2I0TVI3_LIMLA|nr:hypothetical protein llap_11891 [Limosa lapponica baueri]
MHQYTVNANELERSFAEKDMGILLNVKLTVATSEVALEYKDSLGLKTLNLNTSFPQAEVVMVMESTNSSLKELEKSFGNIRKNSREQTGSSVAGKWKSDEEEQETAVGMLIFSSRLANKSKFSSVLEEPEAAKSQRTGRVDYRTYMVSSYRTNTVDK